jgi:hypothetical protein
MKYDKYPIEVAASLREFEFYSEGPKGIVKKQVIFEPFGDIPSIFNFGFGDIDHIGKINDLVVTDNRDGQKVLVTVANTLYRFFEMNPGCFVYAEGSTKARTRLYRMELSRHLPEIEKDFQILGYINNAWEPFKQNRDYKAFLVKKT